MKRSGGEKASSESGISALTTRFDVWRPWARHWILPLVGGVVAVSVLAIILSYRHSLETSRIATLDHLQRVLSQCQDANYPLTFSVISQIKTFSGAEIALLSDSGTITLTTLPLARAELVAISPTSAKQFDTQIVAGTNYDYVLAATLSKQTASNDSAVAVLIPSQRRLASMRESILPQIVLALAAIGLVAAIAVWLISRTMRRLDQMQSQIQRIASGEFLVLDHPGPDDTFSRLADSINSMSRQLAQAHDQIAKTERSRLINLMANGMAHHLRNTLTGASLLLQSYLRQRVGHDKDEVSMAIDQLSFAQETVKRLLASDSGSEMIDETILSIQTIHDRVRNAVNAYAAHRGVHLSFQFRDADRLCELRRGNEIVGALINLVSNGIEAIGTEGAVTCRLERIRDDAKDGDIWHWRIVDNGPGPPADLGDSIREAFVTSKPEGIGLGLTMAACVAERTSGSLSWERLDDQTIFHFRILNRVEHG